MKSTKGMVMGLGALLMAGQAGAATIFAPTDGDVNFLTLGDLNGGYLAMFDDSDQSYNGASLSINLGDVVGIAGPNGSGDYTATNTETFGTLLLTGSDNFILGFSYDATNWMADTSVVSVGANAYNVYFDMGAGNVVQVDVQIVPQVPVPAAVWLFGSGLIGLAGIARRKSHV